MADSSVHTNGTQAREQDGAIDSTGEGELRLEFSGLSEDLGTPNSSLDLENASRALVDLDAHVTPIPSAQAVKSDNHDDNEHGFSDDDVPKTLTTLQPMKKPSPSANDDALTMCQIDVVDGEHEHEEGTILLEVYNEDEQMAEKEPAELQLDGLGRRARSTERKKAIRGEKRAKTISTPGANISIEMPQELLMSCVKSPPRKLDSDELIAILEGDDPVDGGVRSNTTTYEVTILNDPLNSDGKLNMSRDEEREIAMQQILNLPRKKKGRPRMLQNLNKAIKSKVAGASNLVKSLVSDWNDDSEARADDQNETEIVVEINDNGVAAINAVPVVKNKKNDAAIESGTAQPTTRRSRIIKKKIIWDPDAPETAINYASFAHTSGPGVSAKKKVAPKRSVAAPAAQSNSPVPEAATHISTAKKKKTSEIDKLLGDEGAINMLNSLNNQENGNGLGPTSIKSSRIKAIKTDPVEEPVVAVQTKTKRKESTKEPAVPKQGVSPKKVISPTGTGKKRGPKPAAASWDYVYSSRPDDCMIVRRRSNSSYSSTASLNRNSIELPSAPPVIDDDEPPAKKSKAAKVKLFEFTKPTPKLPIRQEEASSESNEASKRKRTASELPSPAIILTKIRKEKKNGAIDAPAAVAPAGFDVEQECSTTEYNEISVKKYKTFAQIILKPLKPFSASENDGPINDNKTLLTAQMMKEVETNLQSLDGDKTCKLVLITSSNSTFCSGIDCSAVLQGTAEKRRVAALELSKKLT